MSWIAVRELREDDVERIQKSAVRFAKRWNITINEPEQTPWSAVEDYVYMSESFGGDGGHLRRLWEKCLARATGVKGATGTAWGNIGYPAKS